MVLPLPLVLPPTLNINFVAPLARGGGNGPISGRICTETLAPSQEANKLKRMETQTRVP